VIFYTYDPANHPHAWKRLNILDVYQTSSRLKVKYSCGSIELNLMTSSSDPTRQHFGSEYFWILGQNTRFQSPWLTL